MPGGKFRIVLSEAGPRARVALAGLTGASAALWAGGIDLTTVPRYEVIVLMAAAVATLIDAFLLIMLKMRKHDSDHDTALLIRTVADQVIWASRRDVPTRPLRRVP